MLISAGLPFLIFSESEANLYLVGRMGTLSTNFSSKSLKRLSSLTLGHSKWIPVYTDDSKTMGCMSIAFLLDSKESAVVWRGPRKTAIIKQFVEDVSWGDLDFLVVDTPPGTSDEHITVCEALSKYSPDGAVIVTTPQNVSIADVRKEITFCRKIGLPILGVVENMSGFVCPHCAECTNIFSSGGGEAMAKELGIPFIGRIPIDPLISTACEAGKSFIEANTASSALDALRKFASEFPGNQSGSNTASVDDHDAMQE